MKTFRLYRDTVTRDGQGITGYLVDEDGVQRLVTYELSYKGNKPFVSSIPDGVYKCRLKWSPSKGRCYEVCDVEGRSDILFHVGNSHLDTEGCILVGKHRNEDFITDSRFAMGEMLISFPDSFKLIIINDY